MSAGKDIEIRIKTIGANQAAEEVDKVSASVEQVEAAAPAAADGIGEIDKNVRKISELQKAQVIAQLGGIIAQMGPQFAAASEAVRGFDSELADTLEKTGEIASRAGEAASTIATGFAAGGPAGAALAAAFVAVKNLAGVWVEMKQAQADAETAAANADAYPLYLQKRRQFLADNAADISRLKTIREENSALAEQEDSFRRLIDLRNELNNEAASAAQKEVQLAKLKGGDVALAEANAIAAQVKAGVEELQGNIAASSNAVNAAIDLEKEAATRLRIEQNKVADGLKTAEQAGIAELKTAAESADKNTQTAQKNLNDILAAADGKLANVVRDGEIALEKAEQEYQGKASVPAQKAFDQVDAYLRSTLAQAPAITQQSIDQISADFTKVNEAAGAKSAEVIQGINQAASGSTQAISQIGQVAQQTNNAMVLSVSMARNQVTDALNMMTQQFTMALAQIAANAIANANQISRHTAQINQLFARTR